MIPANRLRRRLLISFSGGKTSAYMLVRILRELAHLWEEIVVVFANTGQEHEKTLAYVDGIAAAHGVAVVWVEAVTSPVKGEGTRHKVVTFETAARRGEPFEAMIRKHGLPNTQFPHCNRELKVNAIKSYLRSIGWAAGSYNSAVGIRADEWDRMSAGAIASGFIYPLINWGVTKRDVLAWDLRQTVRLGIPEHWGNCLWCWKKSLRKLATTAREIPEAFAFPREMEHAYPDAGPGFGDRRIFRGRRTTDDIFALARDPSFEPFVDGFRWQDEPGEMDLGGSCGDTCEIGADDMPLWEASR